MILDTDSWERGEGLTRLRNPVKAQDLIQRINGDSVPVSEFSAAQAGPQASAGDELVEQLVMRRLEELLAQKDPKRAMVVEEVIEKILSEGWPEEGLDSTRQRVKELLGERLDSTSPASDEEMGGDGSATDQE